MADIAEVTEFPAFGLREILKASNLVANVTNKVNTLIANQVLINTDQNLLLQGAEGGSEQAKIPFFLASAPTGWTRDTGVSDDVVLRVSNGTTVPPGASASATCGGEGGHWTITGAVAASVSNHTHSLAAHVHSMQAHTHSVASHSHTMAHSHTYNHSHTLNDSGSILNAASGSQKCRATTPGTYEQIFYSHGHVGNGAHTHTATDTPTTGAPSGSTGSTSFTSGTPSTANTEGSSPDETGAANVGTHTITFDGVWRPVYTTLLICKRD